MCYKIKINEKICASNLNLTGTRQVRWSWNKWKTLQQPKKSDTFWGKLISKKITCLRSQWEKKRSSLYWNTANEILQSSFRSMEKYRRWVKLIETKVKTPVTILILEIGQRYRKVKVLIILINKKRLIQIMSLHTAKR